METTKQNALGSIHITDKAISAIASQTALSIRHVCGLEANLAEAAAQRLAGAA